VTPEIALINAVRTLLKADAGVTELVSQKVFDQIPPGTKAPYVYVGPASRTRLELDCGRAWSIRLRVYAISTGFNRSDDWDIAEAIEEAVNERLLTLPAPFEMQERIRVTQGGDVIDPNAPKSVFVDVTTTISRAS
jgi:hypothetical protein